MWSMRGSEFSGGGMMEEEEDISLYAEEDLGYEVVEDIFEIDFDYEFDAPRFFDLSRLETVSEEIEAETWFGSAGGYPPSPLIVKSSRNRDIFAEDNVSTSSQLKDVESTTTSVINYLYYSPDSEASSPRGSPGSKYMGQDSPEAKAKPLTKSSSSTLSRLMKPTASRLAKQFPAQEIHCERYARRFQKFSEKDSDCSSQQSRNSQRSSVIENKATKRQKLQAGYLRKVAYLAHQALMRHKIPKQVGILGSGFVHARPKYTIPTAPVLLTAHRAERHRSKSNHRSGELEKQNENPKARLLSKKESNATCSNSESHGEFSHLKRQISPDGIKRKNTIEARQSRKEISSPFDEKFPYEPPTELFSKLSLTSDIKHDAKSQSEKLILSKSINVAEEKSKKIRGKQLKCGIDRRILARGSGPNVVRNLDVR